MLLSSVEEHIFSTKRTEMQDFDQKCFVVPAPDSHDEGGRRLRNWGIHNRPFTFTFRGGDRVTVMVDKIPGRVLT